ncbi:MAG: glycosyltransferase [Bacteroidota bacterium]
MKIVHVISSFGPGGAEVLIKDMAIRSTGEAKVEVWAIGKAEDPQFETDFIAELLNKNVGYTIIGKTPGKQRFWVIKRIFRLIREKNPDIINTHSELATFYVASARLLMKFGLVQTIHNTVIEYPLLQKILARSTADRFVAISTKCKDEILRILKLPEDRVTLIFNGINADKFRCHRYFRKEVKHILNIGRLNHQKDHITLINAYSIVAEELLKHGRRVPVLDIVGTGPLEKILRKETQKLGMTGYIEFMGVRKDIPELLASHDIFVLSSRWEGLSIALLEAMASGIPIVATDVGSNHEIISDGVNGELAVKEDKNSLAEKILRLIDDPVLRKQYSEMSVRKIPQFDIEQCTSRYLMLYRDVVYGAELDSTENSIAA